MKTTILNSEFIQAHPEESETLLSDVQDMLIGMSGLYPDFEQWLKGRVLPGLSNGTRSIIMAHATNNQLAGVAIVKDTELEQKLCCLRVAQDWHGSGLGLKLFDKSFEVLRNENPLLSVSADHYDAFSKIFNHYGFEFVRAYDGLYLPRKTELSFNGLLVPDE